MENKNGFTSRIGFTLAAAGSAVGLGNIWRFPYLAAEYGGGIFLLVYLILTVTFGFALMITEVSIGRKTGKSAILSYKMLNKKFSFLGYIASIIPMVIFPYYCVIGGWIIKYFAVYASNQSHAAAQNGYFEGFISSTAQPIICLAIFIALTSLIVLLGVQKGVEKASTILMPILVVMTIGIAIYNLTLDGSWEGFLFYIKPNFSEFSIKTIIAAMGQMFYSMSLAMGIMITYGSYMRKQDNLEKSVRHIEIFDTGIAFLSGMMIVPAVFAFSGGNSDALNVGPGLMFVTLPKVFNSMAGGKIIGLIFFILVLLAALTSAISLMETIVSVLIDKTKFTRKSICIIVMIASVLIALPSSLGFGVWSGFTIMGYSILDFFDFISNNILMPVLALLTCILIGFIVKPKVITDEVEVSSKFKAKKYYGVLIRYVAPVCLLIILASSLFGIV